MANQEPMIVIKKITVVAGGGHGGAWKVAFADFMTALMAFFLVMWLVSQTDEVKENVADYFSRPSIIEYSFSNYGVELTLEKIFLDLINEPLKAFQSFVEPIDKTPNIFSFGTKRIVMAHLAEKLGDVAKNVNITQDGVEFDIPDYKLFIPGTATPNPKYLEVMSHVLGITTGLEDTDVKVYSLLFHQSVADNQPKTAENVATERLDLIKNKIKSTLESESVGVRGHVFTKAAKGVPAGKRPAGLIRFKMIQKETLTNGRKPRKLEAVYGEKKEEMSIYDNFVKQLSDQKKRAKK